MKRHNKTIKKGMAIATSAMLVMPTSTIGFAQEQSTNSPTSKNVASAQQILENPPSTATPAKDAMNVYTSFTKGNSNNSGNGSIDNPYNRFEDAVAKVANGGTIYIKGEAFLNDVGNNLPFLIDKNITIKTVDDASNASLSVRSAGIILGANVKFENISLDFANKYHDSIFANGYTLDLINVTRSSGSRDIDLFAGGLYSLADGTQVHPSGNKGVINVETNGSFKGGDLESDFGNIYAGSMNGVFNGSAEINVSRKDNSKKLVIGAIKSSGALEAKAGEMLDTTEPLPPAENPSEFPMNGEVLISLDNYQVSVDGTTGSNSKTSVTTSTVYLNNLNLKNVDHLKVESGEIKAVYENTDANTIPNITLGEKAVLDLSQAGIVDVENYNGNGTITLGKNGKLNITNSVNGSINFQTEGAWNGESGKVNEDHVYITTPNKDAVISFVPHYSQSYLELSGRTNGSIVEWVTQEIGKKNDGTTTGFTSNLTVTGEVETPEDEEEGVTPPVNNDKVYLSDLGYVKHLSSTGWGEIQKDRNVEEGYLSLIVDGERVEFDKGIGIHATSSIVFDIRDYSNEYTRLKTHMGIDASKGDNGNGAYLIAYTSQDGVTWKEVHRTQTLKGTSESVELDLDVTGVKLVKLHANNNGNASYDHVSYGDLKLVKEGYVEESPETMEGLKTVAEYDAILSANTPEYNMEHNKLTILQRAFVKKVGYKNVSSIASKNEKYTEAISYLLNDETALNYFITGGDVSKDGSYTRAVREFCEVFSKYENQLKDASDNNFNLRLAISISLAQAYPVLNRFWMLSDKEFGSVLRYETYQDLVKSGKMDLGGDTEEYGKWSTQQFKDLPIPLMRWVVDNRINDDEVDWLTDLALAEKGKNKDYLSAYNYITYTGDYNYDNEELYKEENKEMFNDKFGNFLNYFDDYGTKGVYRLWMIFQEGSVCGGLAKTYSNLADTFGRPSSVVGQPGHAATMTWGWSKANKRYEWMLQNNISGWVESGNEYNDRLLNWGNKPWTVWYNASYNVLATDAILDKNYEEVTILNLLAESYDNNETKKEIYLKALEIQSINLDSMEGLVNAYKDEENPNYFELAQRIVETYTYYPQVMMEMLALIEGDITNSSESAQLDVLKRNTLLSASKATPEKSTNVSMSKELANKYLGGDQSAELATFSFDGENANKIIINSKYEGSGIRVKYSLDGGNKWIESDDHAILLSEEQLKTITAENDIIVGLVGATDDFNYTIDILEGETITGAKVYANDHENLLLGNVSNLEFILEGEDEWCDYVVDGENGINPNAVSGIRFKGNQKVKVRYKANGTRLQSAEKEYVFTENTDTDKRKYVQLKNVNIVEAPEHQGGREPLKAIDGNNDSGFHTKFNTTTQDKVIIVEFNEPKYITSMEYVFGGGNNGRIKNGTIQASLDGETWEIIKTFSNMSRDKSVQEYVMDKVVKAKYIKLVADDTHGNQTGEANMYLSVNELRFYEDTTIVEDEETTPPSDEEIKPETPPTDEGDKEEDTNTPEEDETPSDEVTPEKVVANNEGWLKTDTIGEVAYLWDYTIDKETNTITLKKFKGNDELSGDIKVEIPKSVEGYKVALENLNTATFQDVTHIRIAEGENKVKLLATSLVNGFKDNEKLKYVDLKGLDVSEVTDMTMLFSMCPNLRVINILGWDIQESTIITGMFYAKMNATDEEKKILVIADSEKFNDYNFGDFSGEELVGDNRLPSIVTFSANGGHFFESEDDILNMKIPNYIINTDVLAELDGIIDYYLEQISNPVRKGYKFKGWFTEDKEPTNVYELLNMTYKAKWEKVEEDTELTPPNNEIPDTPNGDEDNKGEGGTDTKPPVEDEGKEEEKQPPANGGIVTPPTMNPEPEVKPEEKPEADEKPEVKPEEKPETKPEATNGIENLKDFDKELQEKVDSLVAESTIDKQQELVLSIVGDDSDLDNVNHVEVTKDGIFAVVEGERLKFEVELDGLNLDLTKSRAIRVNASRNSIVKYSAVAHKNIEDGLKITSNNLENILITSKVAEPFTDVIDTDWFKGYVEEAYNYGFTQGTSDTTYSPQKKITRAQFAVMIARALELSEHETELSITLSDLKGKSYAQQVQQLVEAGIITGYKDQSFKGNNELTRQQAAVMLTRLLNYLGVDTTVKGDVQLKDLSSVSSYAQQSVRYLAEKRIIVSGENVAFNPQGKLTRAQMAKMIVQTLKLTSKY